MAIKRMTSWAVIAAVIGASMAGTALADPPVPFGPGVDLDSDGSFEVEFSKITVELPQMDGMFYRVEFDYAFLSSEGSAGDEVFGSVHDVFTITLLGQTGSLGQTNGAVVIGEEAYTGGFARYDTLAGTVDGVGPGPHIPAIQIAPSGGSGLMFPAQFDDAGVGWRSGAFGFSGESTPIVLEFLVADSDDAFVDSGLAVDNIRLYKLGEESEMLVWTESFEGTDPLAGRAMGNTGTYELLEHIDPFVDGPPPPGTSSVEGVANTVGFGASDGSTFALAATSGVPEPTSIALLAIGGMAVMRRRRN